MAQEVILTDTFFEALDNLEKEDAARIISKLESIVDFPEHYLDRLKNHPGYKLRVGGFRVLIDWDRGDETLYSIDVFQRKNEYRELGKYREVWGTWREN